MAGKSWRPPTPAERALVESWVQAWNQRTGDHATLSGEFVARASCSCGTCPTFSVKPLVLDPAHLDTRPLAVEGTARRANGDPAAGLMVFALDEGEVDFEIYPLDDKSVTLEDVVVRFDDDTVWI